MIVARDRVVVVVDTAAAVAAVVVSRLKGFLANNGKLSVGYDIEHLGLEVLAYMCVVAAVLADSLVVAHMVAYVVEALVVALVVVEAAPYRTEKNDLWVARPAVLAGAHDAGRAVGALPVGVKGGPEALRRGQLELVWVAGYRGPWEAEEVVSD